MDVLEDEYQRPLACEHLHETTSGGEDLAPRRRSIPESDRRRQPFRGCLAVRLARERLRHPGERAFRSERGEDEVAERPVRDPLAVRDASAFEHPRIACDGGDELARQPRLADSGPTEDREEGCGAFLHRGVEGIAAVGQLALSADERRLEVAAHRERPLDDPVERVGGDGLAWSSPRGATAWATTASRHRA